MADRFRRRVQRVRPPTGGPADALVPPRFARRAELLRSAATCLGLLLVILVTTGGFAWWSWETLQDRRVQLGADESLQRSEPDGRSLVDDLVAPARTAKAPAGGAAEPAVLERPTASRPAARPTPVSVDGRLLAGLVIVLATGGATLASREVLRRYRLRASLVERPRGDRRPWSALEAISDSDVEADAGTEVEAQLDTDVEGEAEGASDTVSAGVLHDLRPEESGAVPAARAGSVPATEAGLVDDVPLARLLVEQRQPDEDVQGPGRRAESVPAGAGGSRTHVGSEPHAPSSRWDVEDEPRAERSSVAAEAPVSAQASGYDVRTEPVAHERLYDRRVSRPVPYVQTGWVWWAEANAPVTVQEISLTGLRCLLTDVGVPSPALGEQVRVFFPVNGSTLKVTGRLQWKEHTAQGTDMGVEFLDLPEDAEALVRQVLVS